MNFKNIYTKKLLHEKVSNSKAQLEYELQNYVSSKYDFTPKVYSLDIHSTYYELVMEKINGKISIADFF